MKLSEAINLGAVTVKMEANRISSCAIGAACNAVGAPADLRYTFCYRMWPWTKNKTFTDNYGNPGFDALIAIYSRFDNDVCKGKMTLEQLIDHVASIEPSCGECNRFDCTCTPALAEANEELGMVMA